MEEDTYLTIEDTSEGLFKSKGSKFLAYAYPVNDESEIPVKIEMLRKKHHDARHHCYAWRLGSSLPNFRVYDDGEPFNSAGKPILGQIQTFNLTNILVVVVRYFGGTLLGVGGLIHAYKTASKEALKNAKIVKKYLYNVFTIRFDYPEMKHVMKVLKELEIEHFDHVFKQNCELKVKVRQSLSIRFKNDLLIIPQIKIKVSKKK